MGFSNVFERLGSAIFESPFGANRLAKDAPELAEIRLAVLETAKGKSSRIGGKLVFPYNLIRVHLLGIPDEQASVLQGEFVNKYLREELISGLKRSSYRFPENLVLAVETASRMPVAGETWLSIEATMSNPVREKPPLTAAFLSVLQGTASPSKLLLEKQRVNIGRGAEVLGVAGPSRRNDLAFADDDEIGKSVSREHAHIVCQLATGEYRLFNDRVYKGDSHCGLWIVRDGLSLPVHRSARGTQLLSADEIYLGLAVLRFVSQEHQPAGEDEASPEISPRL